MTWGGRTAVFVASAVTRSDDVVTCAKSSSKVRSDASWLDRGASRAIGSAVPLLTRDRTLREVAQSARVSAATVMRVERGDTTHRVDVLERITTWLEEEEKG